MTLLASTVTTGAPGAQASSGAPVVVLAGVGYPACVAERFRPTSAKDPAMRVQLHRGDTLELRLQVFDADGVTPFSLVGAKVWSTVKRALTDPDAQAVSRVDTAGTSVPSGGSVTVTDAANGRVTVRHAPAATEGFETGYLDLYYDVQVRDSLSRVFTVDHGTIALVPDVTRTAV